MHPFYTLDSQIPCVAGHNLICAAKLVIGPVRQMVCSYWHVDLYATPPPYLLPVSANAPPTSVSPADKCIADCFRLVGLDPATTVESPNTDPSQCPCAAMNPSTHPQSPSTLLPSLSPCTLSAFLDNLVPQQLDLKDLRQNSILPVEADTPTSSSDPLDSICSQVTEHIRVLFLTTVQENLLSQPLATGLKDFFLDHADTFATGYSDLLQHDIDTGETFPIKQSPRRPPLSAR